MQSITLVFDQLYEPALSLRLLLRSVLSHLAKNDTLFRNVSTPYGEGIADERKVKIREKTKMS